MISDALAGKTIDLVVSGSIAAVESVRFIRSLRRLGATVRPWLTEGGAQFTTTTALSWASAGPVFDRFSGENSHIASADVCVIAPASASIIANIAHGHTSTPATALVASYLGMKKPVMLVPNMHSSLFESPAVQKNIETISKWLTIMQPRKEENKLKFPEPKVLADEVAHLINLSHFCSPNHKQANALITMGSTLGYIDDVRYVSNYSSGKLGSLISEELYRFGVTTNVIAGSCEHLPQCSNSMTQAETNQQMADAIEEKNHDGVDSAVFVASVLDYQPEAKAEGKLRSNKEQLELTMLPTEKLISKVQPSGRANGKAKVGFKLETDLNDASIKSIAEKYIKEYQLSMLVLNKLDDVSANKHTAFVVTQSENQNLKISPPIAGKRELAHHVAAHISQSLKNGAL